MKPILFNTQGHDDFIDFIKAYAILCVLFGHTFLWLDKVAYGVWAGMQVPLFILVQSFHYFKKEKPIINLRKIMKRVILPFIILEVLTFLIAVLFKSTDPLSLLYAGLSRGGYGPGAYFPWIFLQIALLLPVFALILNRHNKIISTILFLVICEGFEILLSLVNFPDSIYRLLAIRYFFLIYLGWLWVKDGIKINATTIILSFVSFAAIIYFEYFSINDEPLFYYTNWKFHRWPCYFFVANGFIAILNVLWQWLKKSKPICAGVKQLAAASYEIFLVQMSLIFLVNYNTFVFIPNKHIGYIVWVAFIWILSIGGGTLIHHFFNHSTQSIINSPKKNQCIPK